MIRTSAITAACPSRVARRIALRVGLVSVLLSLAATSSLADSGDPILILPPANPSGRADALAIALPPIYTALDEAGIAYHTPEEIRELLRGHRIRSVGSIGRSDAEILGRETEAWGLLFLSLDIYRDNGGLEVGLSARLLGLDNLALIAAATSGATGESFVGSFGRGRIESIDILSQRVADDLVERLLASRQKLGARRKGVSVALIPFDNATREKSAAKLLENGLIVGLLSRGYEVLEPGFSRELFLTEQSMFRGAIDLAALRQLHDTFGIEYILTGAVDSMEPARGDLTVAVPSMAFGARVVEAPGGSIVLTNITELDGSKSQGLFGRGRTTSLARLVAEAVEGLMDKMDEKVGEETHARKQR